MSDRMPGPDDAGNHTFVYFRAEVVTKPDGRYLVYYSWPPDDTGQAQPAAGAARERTAPPGQQPWSPETGPSDV